METEISYDEAGESTDVETLVEYCKRGAIENTNIEEFDSGMQIVYCYLEHNKIADSETLKEVASRLDQWLNEIPLIRNYSIVFRDNSGSRAVEAIAHSCGGAWCNSVQRYDGKHDLAFIDLPRKNAQHLEQMLDEDDNVVSYKER